MVARDAEIDKQLAEEITAYEANNKPSNNNELKFNVARAPVTPVTPVSVVKDNNLKYKNYIIISLLIINLGFIVNCLFCNKNNKKSLNFDRQGYQSI